MSKLAIGIDPGFSGAVSVINGASLVDVIPNPLLEIPTGKTIIRNLKRVPEVKLEIDATSLYTFLKKYKKARCLIEKVSSFPEQGVVSVFNFGQGYGTILGVLGSLSINTFRVAPSKWKKDMGLDSDKSKSILKCLELFPTSLEFIKYKKDDGKAEATLLAWYLNNMFRGGS